MTDDPTDGVVDQGDRQAYSRRTVLALCGAATGGLAGCLGRGSSRNGTPIDSPTDTPPGRGTPTDTPGPGTPSHTPDDDSAVETVSYDGGDPLSRADAVFPQRDVGSYYLALLSTKEQATAFAIDRLANPAARELVAETDYATASVVVLHDRRGSSFPDLKLVSAGVEGRTLTAEVRYPGQGGTADVRPNTLVARVPTAATPDAARAVLHLQGGDTVQFATLSAYDEQPAFDPAGDLVVRNRDCSPAPLGVTVSYGSDLFHRSRLELDPATVRGINGVFAYPGEWTVTIERGPATTTRTWSLTDAPPGDVLVEVGGDGSVSLARRPDGADTTDPETCETNGYPYESPHPEANLEHPVDLWVLDRSDGSHRLTVTIRDGDTTVWSSEFDTHEGYDKAVERSLLAKQTTYEVEVTADGNQSLSEPVTIKDGVTKLTVRVTEAGELAVGVE